MLPKLKGKKKYKNNRNNIHQGIKELIIIYDFF